jgi:hypothetical protein
LLTRFLSLILLGFSFQGLLLLQVIFDPAGVVFVPVPVHRGVFFELRSHFIPS